MALEYCRLTLTLEIISGSIRMIPAIESGSCKSQEIYPDVAPDCIIIMRKRASQLFGRGLLIEAGSIPVSRKESTGIGKKSRAAFNTVIRNVIK